MRASDDFNRSNGGVGANWTALQNHLSVASGHEIVSNQCRAVQGSGAYAYSVWATSLGADQWSEIVDVNAAAYSSPMVRMPSSGQVDGYLVLNAGSDEILYRVDNGSFTSLQTGISRPAAGSKVLLVANGSSLRIYDDGVQIGTNQTDATYATGGVGIMANNDGSATVGLIDNWQGGDLATPSGTWSQTFSDSFTGTQFTNLPAYNAAWAENATNGHHRISTNGTSAGAVAFASARTYVTGGSAPGNDQACQVTMLGSSFAHDEGLLLRFTDGNPGTFWGGTGYVCYLAGGGSATLELHRIDGAGAHVQLASTSYTATSGDVLRFEAIGSLLIAKINGSETLKVWDPTYTTGAVGLFAGVSFDNSDFMSYDVFVAEAWVSGQILYAVSDVSAGSWTPSTGTGLYPMLNDAGNDTTHIRSSTGAGSDAATLAMDTVITPSAGTVKIRIRHRTGS